MSAVIFGSLILAHLHRQDGNSIMFWLLTGIAAVATTFQAVMFHARVFS